MTLLGLLWDWNVVGVLVFLRILLEGWFATGAAEVVAVTLVVGEQLGFGRLLDVNFVLWHHCAVEILGLTRALSVDRRNDHCADQQSCSEFLHVNSSIVTNGGKSFVFAYERYAWNAFRRGL